MKNFDPYHKWLGIPKKDQPPHHYRLLGLELYEDDPDVIEAAADRCMAFVQQCALGEYLEASQQILNELAAARVCLLVPEQKTQYDAELRARLASFQTETSTPVAEQNSQPEDPHPIPVRKKKKAKPESIRSAAILQAQTKGKPEQQSPQFLQNLSPQARKIAGGLGLFCILLMLLLIGRQFMAGDSGEPESPDLAAEAEPAATQPEETGEPAGPEQTQPPQEQDTRVAQTEQKAPPPENNTPVKPEPEPLLPMTSHTLLLTVRGETPDQRPGDPLKDVLLELVYRPRETPGQQIRLVTATTDKNGQGRIQIQVNPQQTGTLLAKVTKENTTWERELAGFPKVLSHTLTIPASEKPDYLNPDWIEKRLAQIGIDQLIEEYETEQAPLVQTVRGSLDLSRHILRAHPDALREQLQARLVGRPEPELAVFQKLPKDRMQFRSEWPTFDQPGGTLVRTLSELSDQAKNLVFSTDGKRAIFSLKNEIQVWDLHNNKLIRTLEGHSKTISGLAISIDGNRVISASRDNLVNIWDLKNGKLLNSLSRLTHSFDYLSPTSDGSKLVTGNRYDKETFKIWDLISGNLIRTLERHSGKVNCVTVSPDSKQVFAGFEEGTIAVWDISSGKLVRQLKGHSGSILSLAMTPDGKQIISGLIDGTVRVWSSNRNRILHTLREHSGPVTHVSVTPDSQRVFTAAEDNLIKVWNLTSGKLIRTLKRHSGKIKYLHISEDGRELISGTEGECFVWDLTSSGLSGENENIDPQYINCVVVTPDGERALFGCDDHTVKEWDLSKNQIIRTLTGNQGPVKSIALTEDGKTAVSGSDHDLVVWGLVSGTLIQSVKLNARSLDFVAVSPEGKEAFVGIDNSKIDTFGLNNDKFNRTLINYGNSRYIRRIRRNSPYNIFDKSMDGKYIISGSSNGLTVWDLEWNGRLKPIKTETDIFTCYDISPDGKYIVYGCIKKHQLKIRNIADGQLIKTLEGHTDINNHVGITPDAKYIISCSLDKSIKTWDFNTGALVASYYIDDAVRDFAICSDNQTLVLVGTTGRIYKLRIQDSEAKVANPTRPVSLPATKNQVTAEKTGTVNSSQNPTGNTNQIE